MSILLLLLLLSPYLLWLFYLAVMALDLAKLKGRDTPIGTLLGKPILFVGYVLDVALNFTLFSLFVLDVPREWTITSHVNRILATPISTCTIPCLGVWRYTVAAWLCRHLLNPFDPSGSHCNAQPKDAP